MRKLYLVIAALIISLAGSAQVGSLIWQKCYGGSGPDSARSVANTTDGGYYVAGVTYSNDGNVTGNHNPNGDFSDIWVIKVDMNGALVWEKTFGGSFQDQANSIYATADGGAIIAGSTNSSDGDVTSIHGTAGGASDVWVIKIDNTGTLQWQKTYGGSKNDYAQSIKQTTDGGYIVAGSTYSNDGDVTGNHDASGATADFLLMKLDSVGDLMGAKCYGGSLNDFATGVEQTNDGGFIVTGSTFSSDGNVSRGTFLSSTTSSLYWLLKLDNTGAFSWQSCFGGTYPSTATGVVQTTDNAYVMSGYTYTNDYNVSGNYGGSSGSTADNWIVKGGSTNGSMQWENCWGGSSNDWALAVKQTRDAHLIITGATTSTNGLVSANHGAQDLWTYEMKTSGYANYWYSCFGGSNDDAGFDATESADSNFVEVGATNSNDQQVSGNHGSYDFWVIKTQSEEGAPATAIQNISAEGNVLSVYPNPASLYTTVTVSDNLVGNWMELSDAVGRLISRQQITNPKMHVSTQGLASGLYLLKAGNAEVKKLIVE